MTGNNIIEKILEILSNGSKTELALNLLLFTDFSRWEQNYLRYFIDRIKEIIKAGHESNKILVSYNPI